MLDKLIRDICSVWKYILFKKRLIWAGKKQETLSPNEKPVSNESCLPHGHIPAFKLKLFLGLDCYHNHHFHRLMKAIFGPMHSKVLPISLK